MTARIARFCPVSGCATRIDPRRFVCHSCQRFLPERLRERPRLAAERRQWELLVAHHLGFEGRGPVLIPTEDGPENAPLDIPWPDFLTCPICHAEFRNGANRDLHVEAVTAAKFTPDFCEESAKAANAKHLQHTGSVGGPPKTPFRHVRCIYKPREARAARQRRNELEHDD